MTKHKGKDDSELKRTWKVLLLALQQAVPGELIVIELNPPRERRKLPGKLKARGLERSFEYVHCEDLPVGPVPAEALETFLLYEVPCRPEVLFVDGLETHTKAGPESDDWLNALNFGREHLAALGLVLVFLVPRHVVDTLRAKALNLWSWCAHHFVL